MTADDAAQKAVTEASTAAVTDSSKSKDNVVEIQSKDSPSNEARKDKPVNEVKSPKEQSQLARKDTAAASTTPAAKEAATSRPDKTWPDLMLPRVPIVVGLQASARDTPPATGDTTGAPAATALETTNAPTTPAAKPPATKKRKLSNPGTAPPQSMSSARPVMTPHTPLADPAVAKSVHDIMGLLQTYGPLTFGQLEYNLPPIASLQDILEVMVSIGIVQVVDDKSDTLRYTMLHGIPRSDVVLPQTVVDDILDAQTEVTRCMERCQLLKNALLSGSKNSRELLKRILLQYPEITNDPIYVAALRNVHVDVAAMERERLKQQRMLEEEETTKEGEGDTLTEPNPDTPVERAVTKLEPETAKAKDESPVL